MEQELGEERQLNPFEGTEEDWEQQPLPDGPMTVGIDGGYVRGVRKQGWFEVIAGKLWWLSGETMRTSSPRRSAAGWCKPTMKNHAGGYGN